MFAGPGRRVARPHPPFRSRRRSPPAGRSPAPAAGVDGPALVRGHVRGVMRRDHERVDVPRRDGLLRIPRELRDRDVARDRNGSSRGSRVLVRLQRSVDAEVRAEHVRRKHARIDRARQASVVERRCDRASGPGRGRRLELVGRLAGQVDVVVHDHRRAPREASAGRLRELRVLLTEDRIPVLIREVEVPGEGRAGGEALGDSVPEALVRECSARRGASRS